ncbi:starch synthase [Lebetimonas natsushimae]|uniref:Glycogen synthase n=1 Tax=Lebetimonas natsushimae TaxID=1936991 RepID=A0A292YDJ7_9BACT|nr:glycogen/starch synthase [Lebetimonas natsushimae]GAX87459.1 starch synthase [Lebetimonas natsushimae]
MNIMFASSEVAPFAKTGGLADVSAALPKALSKLGHNVKIIMPRYYNINPANLEKLPFSIGVPIGGLGTLWAGVYKSYLPGSRVEVYFIDYEEFFGRSGIYADENGYSYVDNDKRFIFFTIAVFELALALKFDVDIFHFNDWQTAAGTALLKYRYNWLFPKSKSVLTIHNLEHQGVFSKDAFNYLMIDWSHFNLYEFEAMGLTNLLKGGIAAADKITTVSPTYAKEIQTPEFGFGLQEHIKAHSYKLVGILNGVDYDEWNPKTDKLIPFNYDVENIEIKRKNKLILQERMGLEKNERKCLIGLVSRFAKQKGIELIAASMVGLLHLNADFVFLGSGEKWAEGFFSDISSRYANFRVYVGYNNELAHLIEAGSDIFLMPSMFEPCGLNQMYSLRYGTPPIVRAVGGLNDTVENYNPFTKDGTGFKFYDPTREALINTTKWAVDSYYKDEGYKIIQKRGMQKRFSWERSAKEYEKIYKELV